MMRIGTAMSSRLRRGHASATASQARQWSAGGAHAVPPLAIRQRLADDRARPRAHVVLDAHFHARRSAALGGSVELLAQHAAVFQNLVALAGGGT